MRRPVVIVLAFLLVAGCTKDEPEAPTPQFEDDTQPTPTPTPTPTTRPSTPPPAPPGAPPTPPTAPTPPTPPTPPPPPAGPSRLVNWSFTLSVGGPALPLPGAPTDAQNCVAIPSVEMIRGQANATWGGATPLSGTSLDLVVIGATVNASVSGASPLTLSWTAVPKGNETLVAMYLSDESAPVSPRVSVELAVVFEIPGGETEPAMPAPKACAR